MTSELDFDKAMDLIQAGGETIVVRFGQTDETTGTLDLVFPGHPERRVIKLLFSNLDPKVEFEDLIRLLLLTPTLDSIWLDNDLPVPSKEQLCFFPMPPTTIGFLLLSE